MSKTPFFIAAYALVGLLVFGFAFNNQPPISKKIDGTDRATHDADRFFLGALSGIFWPLYVSVKIFEKQPEAKQ
jgi:hypothetical protein